MHLMNEMYRVLQAGGLFFAQTPADPCKEAFPIYFFGPSMGKLYGFSGSFTLVAQEWCRPSLLTLIQKP